MTHLTQIATVALVRRGRVLLVHRHPAREHYPDCWDLPGGHVEPGERPCEAAVREAAEELGVEVLDGTELPVVAGPDHLDLRAFVATRWRGEPANLAPDEHDDLGWFARDELAGLRLVHPAMLETLTTALSEAATTC